MQTLPTLVFWPRTVLHFQRFRNIVDTNHRNLIAATIFHLLYHTISTVDYLPCHEGSRTCSKKFLGAIKRKNKIQGGTYLVKVFRRLCQQRTYHFEYVGDSDDAIERNNLNSNALLWDSGDLVQNVVLPGCGVVDAQLCTRSCPHSATALAFAVGGLFLSCRVPAFHRVFSHYFQKLYAVS